MHKDSRRKDTFWNFVFLNLKFVIGIINGILIVPLYLYYITTPLYGAWLATGNILIWINAVDPGVGGVVLQKIAYLKGNGNKEEIGLAVAASILVSILLFIIVVSSGYILSIFIVDIARIDIGYRDDITGAFRIAVWGTALNFFSNTFTSIVLGYQKTKLHGYFLTSILVISLIIKIVLLFNNFGVYALAYSNLFLGFAVFSYSLIATIVLIKRDSVILKFRFSYLKSFSKIFTYTFSGRLIETIASNIDLILVSRYIGPGFVTILDFSRRPLKMASELTNNITVSMLPTMAHLFGTKQNDRARLIIMQICTTLLWVAGFIICGFLLFNQDLINNWVGPEFWFGGTNNAIMCFSFFLLAIGIGLSNITYSMGDIRNNSLINIARSVVYIISLYFLSKHFGITGVLISFTLSIAVMVWYYPIRLIKMAGLSLENIRDIKREALIILVLLVSSFTISYLTNLRASWESLIGYCLAYSVIFVSIMCFFSSRFRGAAILVLNRMKIRTT